MGRKVGLAVIARLDGKMSGGGQGHELEKLRVGEQSRRAEKS